MNLEEIKNILNDKNKKFSFIIASSLEELIAEIEEAAVARCMKIAESISHRPDDMGAIIANNIKKQFDL